MSGLGFTRLYYNSLLLTEFSIGQESIKVQDNFHESHPWFLNVTVFSCLIDHLKTWLVRYSDPCCRLLVYRNCPSIRHLLTQVHTCRFGKVVIRDKYFQKLSILTNSIQLADKNLDIFTLSTSVKIDVYKFLRLKIYYFNGQSKEKSSSRDVNKPQTGLSQSCLKIKKKFIWFICT
jgi:hypothetical protein